MSGFTPGSQDGSDHEPTKVGPARTAEPDASSSSALKSHLSSAGRPFAVLKSRRAEREDESQPRLLPCKNPNSRRRDCTQRRFCASLRSRGSVAAASAVEIAGLGSAGGAGGAKSSGGLKGWIGGDCALLVRGALVSPLGGMTRVGAVCVVLSGPNKVLGFLIPSFKKTNCAAPSMIADERKMAVGQRFAV